ncbi:MAG: alpha/beta hydrolase [Bdellovibrionales bacterium]|nr:alpha/beta hydrolase [Oligoflexia bacterium]
MMTLHPQRNQVFALLFNFLLVLTFKNPAYALDNSCLSRMQSALRAIDEKENSRALLLDSATGQVRAGNESVFFKGSPDKVAFILHGFLGSPFEVRPLAEALHQAGYTVVVPLVAGFGRSTAVADKTTAEIWLESTRAQLAASELCGSKIQVIGFSLGALLETKILLKHPELRAKVASLTLLSPALKLQADSLLSVSASFFSVLNSTPRVSLLASPARKVGNHDLDIPEIYPDFYNNEIPLSNVKELTQLAASVDYSLFKDFGAPVKVIYSESDHTIDGASSLGLLRTNLPKVSASVLSAELNVPHQILVSWVTGAKEKVIAETLKSFQP